MNAMPLSAGSASKNLRAASSPPADAPIPTTVKAAGGEGATVFDDERAFGGDRAVTGFRILRAVVTFVPCPFSPPHRVAAKSKFAHSHRENRAALESVVVILIIDDDETASLQTLYRFPGLRPITEKHHPRFTGPPWIPVFYDHAHLDALPTPILAHPDPGRPLRVGSETTTSKSRPIGTGAGSAPGTASLSPQGSGKTDETPKLTPLFSFV